MLSLKQLPNQRPGETVELFLRRHWIDLLKIALLDVGLCLVPVALYVSGFWPGAQGLDGSVFWDTVASLGLSGYLMFVLVITMTELTDYWLDTWIVTSERIINIEQHGLFKRTVSELPLDQVQDVTSETHGFLETFLTYGDVYIQSAGERQRFQFKNIDNQDAVKEKIIGLVQRCKVRHGA
jgi:hypothetical protein